VVPSAEGRLSSAGSVRVKRRANKHGMDCDTVEDEVGWRERTTLTIDRAWRLQAQRANPTLTNARVSV
jgi:hypothetical protein